MIISASRRTDIPAFFGDWLFERLEAGHCDVKNPFNGKIQRVSLQQEDVDAIVFWSKNPRPLMARLDELDSYNIPYYFQYTLNDYPTPLEPNLPQFEERIETFRELSARLGALRVVWRYDPIVISNLTPPEFHIERFSCIAMRLQEYTDSVFISLLDSYRAATKRLTALSGLGISVEVDWRDDTSLETLVRGLVRIARGTGMRIFSCAENPRWQGWGTEKGRCVDSDRVNRIAGLKLEYSKDRGQRTCCGCTKSRDIGTTGTCGHGCAYCYANPRWK